MRENWFPVDDSQFIIFKRDGAIPVMAGCKACERKFFTPSNFSMDVIEAEVYLRHKFQEHKCSSLRDGGERQRFQLQEQKAHFPLKDVGLLQFFQFRPKSNDKSVHPLGMAHLGVFGYFLNRIPPCAMADQNPLRHWRLVAEELAREKDPAKARLLLEELNQSVRLVPYPYEDDDDPLSGRRPL